MLYAFNDAAFGYSCKVYSDVGLLNTHNVHFGLRGFNGVFLIYNRSKRDSNFRA